MTNERPAVPPGMRAQLDSSTYMGVPALGLRPRLTEPEQLDEWKPDVAVVGATPGAMSAPPLRR